MIQYTEKGYGLHNAIRAAGHWLREENGAWVSSNDEAVQAIIDSKMESLAHALAAANGCTAEVKLKWGTTALVNHDENTETAIAAASINAARIKPFS